MSNQNNFAGGFLLGAVFGGVLGGILGATLVSRKFAVVESTSNGLNESNKEDRRDRDKGRKRTLSGSHQPDFEMTRRGLEDKIAQLNDAIDVARKQLANPRLESDSSHSATPDVGQPRKLMAEEV